MLKSLTIFLFTLSLPALAEYRVYQYLVKNTTFKNQDQNAYLAISTLDPVSFKAYKSGSLNIKVDLMRTWMCPGYTGMGTDYCPSPYEKVQAMAEQGRQP